MKKLILLITLFFLFFPAPIIEASDEIPLFNETLKPLPRIPATGPTLGYAADRIIVKFKEGMFEKGIPNEKSSLSMLNSKYGASAEKLLKKTSNRDLDRLYVLKLPRNSDIKKIVEEYNDDLNVEYAEPDYMLYAIDTYPNDPYFSLQWGLNNSGQFDGTLGADMDALAAWGIANGSEEVVVAVIDSGVDYTHPDLEANMWTNPRDGSHGWDFVNNDNDPIDDNGHGTHCAGIIGAIGNNSLGIAGVNWKVKIAAIKFLDSSGSGSTTNAISAINYANLMGFKILSNSWGGGGYSKALYDAIQGYNLPDAGSMLFIAAAGNSGSNNDVTPHYPCSYNLNNLICVAATDNNDSLASFSNYGATTVDIGAPGHYIYSTVPTGSCELCNSTGYDYLSGTSMATPFVSGAAALIKAKFPDINASQIKARILYSIDRIDSLNGKVVSNGRLNVYNALHEDDTPPATVTDLTIVGTDMTNVTLSWTAVGDDGNEGNSTYYDIRYSTSEINESNFVYAPQVSGIPTPEENGSAETFVAGGTAIGAGINPGTTYYFAIKVYDEVGNPSDISNVVSDITTEPPSSIPGCDYLVNSSNYLIDENNTNYCLFADVATSTHGVLFANYTENTTLDCRNFTIYGTDSLYSFGVYLGLYTGNNSIRNCRITDFHLGVVLDFGSSQNNLTNITANSNVFGIEPYYSNYNIMRNIRTVNNSDDGITFYVADYNKLENAYISGSADASSDGIIYSYNSWHDEFVNVTIANASASGFYMGFSINTTINDSKITNCGSYGIRLYYSGSPPNKIYNNLFNNTNNLYIAGTIYANYWNATRLGSSKVYSYGAVGGNYWTNPSENGYSNTCLDANADGFCDSPYDVLNNRSCTAGVNCSSNTDYLPYSSAGTGLVGFWNLNEGTGTTANDSSGNGNTGTISGATWTASGKYRNALRFDGVNDQVSIANPSFFSFGSTDFTICAWIKPAELTGSASQYAVGTYNSSSTTYWLLGTRYDQYYFTAQNSSGSKFNLRGSSASLDEWTHLCITRNDSNFSLWENGVYINSTSESIGSLSSPSNVYMGTRGDAGSYFNGTIDEVKIYGKALSETQITGLYD